LNDHDVKYLLVGGYAVGLHSEPRTTKDLDVYIRADEKNSRAVFRALASFGAPIAGMSPADFNDGKSWFQMGFPPERIDILQKIDGIEFDEAWETRIYAIVNDFLRVPVISAEKLIRNKLAAGRPRDLLDVEEIREAQLYAPPTHSDVATMIVSGWNVGFQKVECTKLLRMRLGLSLSEAKKVTDAILSDQSFALPVPRDLYDPLAADLIALGVKWIWKEAK
jgi:ribosomal protein L7/L12